MKKTVFTAIAIFISLGVYAQFEQGTIMVGGSFGADFQTEKVKSGSTTSTLGKKSSVTLNPQVGYFVIDNLAAGLGLTVISQSAKDDGSSNKSSSSTLLFSPFLRYYLDQGIFFQGRFDVGSSKDKDVVGSTTTTTNYGNVGWALSGGYALFLTDGVALEPQIGYGSLSYKNKNNSSKLIDSGLFLRLGFMIYLKK